LILSLLALGLAVGPAAFVDRGATGSVRGTFFPFALILFDPFVWTCVCNSLLIAGLVAGGSLFVGLALASCGTTWNFRGRSLLWSLAMVPLAAGPLLLAPAIGLSLTGPRARDWLSARDFAGFSLDDLVRWVSLVWVELASFSPIVALAIASAYRRIEPVWVDAAKANGASRREVWRGLIWPILRPEAAKVTGLIFTLVLIEPAGPLILGLNRTLAVEILQTAFRIDQPTRVAGLALLAIVLATVGRTLIHWWGGPSFVTIDGPENRPTETVGLGRASFARVLLFGWVTFAVGPLVWLSFASFRSLQTPESGVLSGFLRTWFNDPELTAWAANSVTTASLAVLLDFVILSCLMGQKATEANRGLRFASNFLRGFPPLALGVGAFSMPWLLDALADSVGGLAGRWAHQLALELSPARAPGFLLILVVAAGKWPTLFLLAERTGGTTREVLVEAARLMGEPDHRANRGTSASFIPARTAVLVLALAATNLAPALLMSPFSERRTMAPAIVRSVHREGRIDPRVGSAVLVVLAGKLVAFALASRTRAGRLGDWYRG
jgi:iron(III) transport system permease protein